ncbi:MAG TPA: CHASE2 domain-containing protein [Leptolyngbyaceae cyanobacterium M33_DOE_097]|uniref:CHASE2 domain-containing protein n=1 Tax=Oscillatoriales cyanobacterium SpSt-418 TaxID=2282169 RepID=A0A7C3KJC8_9CYAN|nr:CHASE2 domain-containing protein [Leptolyngbyaceae cyanobacterium M33_DOE_097]
MDRRTGRQLTDNIPTVGTPFDASFTVVLSLGTGNLHDGFPRVTAQIWEHEGQYPMKFVGSLPPAPDLGDLYRVWKLLYEALSYRLCGNHRIEVEPTDVTNVSEMEFGQLCQQFTQSFNTWLHTESFQPIEQQLRTRLDIQAFFRLLVETDDPLMQRFPWHLWNFLADYRNGEMALCHAEHYPPPLLLQQRDRVKILAIFGNSDGIDVQIDRQLLEQYSNQAEIECLVEPSLQQLQDALWQGCDLLFFAGHSSSQERGVLRLNSREKLPLEQLRYGLQRAISQGLKLAIFNSCDGLGLAQQLADLNIPQVIVMREPVPDPVAHTFLKYFLVAFMRGDSLYTSVREARERLQSLETQYPCATWLPVICQNPAIAPQTWQEWLHAPVERVELTPTPVPRQQRFYLPLIISVTISALVMGVRWLGWLQPFELQAFDQFMRLRPAEPPDQHLLIVAVTEEDLQLPEQKDRKGSLSDQALEQLLKKLLPYQPRAIALDIYRDFPVQSRFPDLTKQLKTETRFFSICKSSSADINDPGVAPPPEVALERHGFSNVLKDADGVIRRHLIGMEPDPTSICVTPYALSTQLAFYYLANEGIKAQFNADQNLQIGDVVFKRLRSHWSGYQGVDAWGYQILLNYRSHHSSLNIAPIVTLKDVLAGQLSETVVKDRIVLIGTTASSFQDFHSTPYSSGYNYAHRMPGVIVQAQMVSQLISAVKDKRPLLNVLPIWGEVIWVMLWTGIASFVAWRSRAMFVFIMAIAGICLGVFVSCLLLLIQGYWIPLIPVLLAVILTSIFLSTKKSFFSTHPRLK